MTIDLYALVENRPGHPNFGRPFYIGIGGKKRPKRHLREARSAAGHRNWRLQEVLGAHFVVGVEPAVTVLQTFDDWESAGAAEKAAIAGYGRAGIDPGGTLANLACGGQGPDPALMSLPEIRERNRQSQLRRSPESRARSNAALRRNRLDPAVEARRRENSREPQKASWQKPEVREARVEGMRGTEKTLSPEALAARTDNLNAARSPEARAAHAQAMRDVWQRPEHIEKRSRNQAAAWTDPEKRANMLAGRSDGIANSWKDPDVRARRIAGIKAARPAKLKQEGPGRSATMRAVNAAKTAEARAAEQRTAWADQETREKRLAGIRAAAQRPELRAARLAAMAEGKRRKAAERAALRSQTRDGDGS